MTFLLLLLILVTPIIVWKLLKRSTMSKPKRFFAYLGLTWIAEIAVIVGLTVHLV